VSKLQRFFFAFPGGLPGIALLLLRAALGCAIAVQGGFYLRIANATPLQSIAGWGAVLTGVLLVAGCLTPVAAILAGLEGFGVWLSLIPPNPANLFDANVTVVFAAAMLLAIAALGPGAFSIDARVFGRREIIIPPPVPRP
jgi:uncharacterized membrane protein YphA (DoxX/SURF4 family)